MTETTESEIRHRALRFEVILGAVYFVSVVLVLGIGTWVLVDRDNIREETRAETVRTSEIRSIENCNEIERLKFAIRFFLTTIDLDPISRTAAERSFRPIPGGSFINERGQRQWRGCGEFPEPVD